MQLEIKGSIKRIGSRIDASGDIVQSLVLEVFGDIGDVSKFLKETLKIVLLTEDEKG